MPNPFSLESFDQAKQALLEANRVLILSHKNPDADSVGANLALREALENMGKSVVSACIDEIPDNCRFLRKAEQYLRDFETQNFDLVVTVDCGGHKLMGFHEKKPELLDRTKVRLLNIDHHPSNDLFGNVNVVLPQTPSTCFILYLFFNYCGWGISPSMATALMHGLYYDTGGLMHPNTTADTYRIAARLKALGADQERCMKELFHTASIPKLRLWGRALSRSSFNEKKAVVAALTQEDYKEEQAELEDLSGLVNYLNQVPEAQFCVLLTEDFHGNIKASLRTQREEVDLTQIAGLFGGGGHKKAAGFTIPGRLHKKSIWGVT